MSGLLLGLVSCVLGQAPGRLGPRARSLPVVVATSRPLTDLDRALVAHGYLDDNRKVVAQNYVLVELKGIRLAYRFDTLELRRALEQMEVLRQCTDRIRSSDGAIGVGTLSADAQTTIRQMIADGNQGLIKPYAGAPGLRLCPGLRAEFDVRYGGRQETVALRPRLPNWKGSPESFTPADKSVQPPKPDEPWVGTSGVTYVLPREAGEPGARLGWLAQAQTYLAELAIHTDAEYRTLSKALKEALMAKDPDRYGRVAFPSQARFRDLDPASQHQVAQELWQEHPEAFADQDAAMSFLTNRTPVDSRIQLTLSAYVILDRSERSASIASTNLTFESPVGSP